MCDLEALHDTGHSIPSVHVDADGVHVDGKAMRLQIPTGGDLYAETVRQRLLSKVPTSKQDALASFIVSLYQFYRALHFAHLEINPLVMLGDKTVVPLDMAAKIDGQLEYRSPGVAVQIISYKVKEQDCFSQDGADHQERWRPAEN